MIDVKFYQLFLLVNYLTKQEHLRPQVVNIEIGLKGKKA